MKEMNDIICTMQENVEHIAGNLNRVMFAMDCLERLDGKISNYMGQRFGTLEFAKGNLDKLAMYLVEDLNEELSKTLADIEADEEEVNAYAAMYADDDLLPEEGPDQDQEPEAGQDHDQEGGEE